MAKSKNRWIENLSCNGRSFSDIIKEPDALCILDRIGAWAKSIWENAKRFEHYTDHGIEHSWRIGQQLNHWFQNRQGINLNSMEAFILLGAIYLHDIGMQCRCEDDDAEVCKKVIPLDKLQNLSDETVRHYHHRLSKIMIEEKIIDLAGQNKTYENALNAVSVISQSHGENFPADDLQDHCKINDKVRLKYLAYLLRIGDCLDATKERVNDNLISKWQDMRTESKMHAAKHLIIEEIKFDDVFKFVYSRNIPESWRKVRDDLVTIAMSTLKKDRERYNTYINYYKYGIPLEGELIDNEGENGFQNDMRGLELSEDLCKEIRKEAIRCRISDAGDCIKEAKKEMWIIGQNLYALVNPTRDIGYVDKDYFKKKFFDQMKTNMKKISLLILDPRRKRDVDYWNARLNEQHPTRLAEGITFKKDLKEAIGTFQKWQQEAIAENPPLPLEIKCGELMFDSANICDPGTTKCLIYYTRTVPDAHSHPLHRKWDVSRYAGDGFRKKLQSYQKYLAEGISIMEINESVIKSILRKVFQLWRLIKRT